MAGNGYDNGRGGTPRQGRDRAPQQYGGAPAAPPAGAFGSYRGTQPTGQGSYGPGPQPGMPPGQPTGAPEYFGGPPAGAPRLPYDDNPGHTQAFSIDESQYDGGYRNQGYAPPDEDHVAVYRAGNQTGPHAEGPRPNWRELLSGMYLNPSRTFDRVRGHQVWLPALTVSLIYGVLAVFGFGDTRSEVLDSTASLLLWTLLGTAIGFTLAGAMLGGVTQALARQFGGTGDWQSTVGLSALIAWTTDIPRLLFALFLPADGAFVQVLGLATWLLCAGLMTTMIRRIHDLPWGKAGGAAALQLIALLILIKLPTLS